MPEMGARLSFDRRVAHLRSVKQRSSGIKAGLLAILHEASNRALEHTKKAPNESNCHYMLKRYVGGVLDTPFRSSCLFVDTVFELVILGAPNSL